VVLCCWWRVVVAAGEHRGGEGLKGR
jgi:hypothetical protein